MKHLGLHEFPQKTVTEDATVFNNILLNKLNIPFHKDINGAEFGDMFTESNVVKFVNNEGEINLLLDINNDDVIKNLLVSEMIFDDFFNYNKDLQISNSFHTKLELEEDIFQKELNFQTDATLYVDATTLVNIIELDFTDSTISTEVYNRFVEYLSSGLPLFTRYINTIDSTVIEQMSIFLTVDKVDDTMILTVKVPNFNALLSTNRVEILTFKFVDNDISEPMVSLPPHTHSLSHLYDLLTNTNTVNGYIKLDGTDAKLDFEQNLQLKSGRVINSILSKQWSEQLKNETKFAVSTKNSITEDVVGYNSTIIDLGNDTTIIEYDITSVEITFRDSLKLYSDSGQVATNNLYSKVTSDYTTFQEKYLVEIIEFNYDYIFGSESINDINFLITSHQQQQDKTSINDLQEYNIDLVNKKIICVAGYYDITLFQPTITTIPDVLLNYISICKDYEKSVLLIKPIIYNNLNGDFRLNLNDSHLLRLEFNDSTASTLLLQIKKFNILSGIQENQFAMDMSVDADLMLERGMYKIKTNTDTYSYNVIYY